MKNWIKTAHIIRAHQEIVSICLKAENYRNLQLKHQAMVHRFE